MKKQSLVAFLFSLVLVLPVFASTGAASEHHHARKSEIHSSQAEHHHVRKSTTQQAQDQVVNINSADVKELTTLKGIGNKRAADIVVYRKQHGDFKTAEDLKNVKGISEKIIEANKARIAV